MLPKVRADVVQIRPATTDEAERLTELALRSKAHWGYDADFIQDCRTELTLTPEYVAAHPVFVAELDNEIAGFCTLVETADEVELDHLYIEPSMIGAGTGRLLFRHAMSEAKRLGHRHVLIHSDPHAETFYLAMGAVRIGETASPVRVGRVLPLLRYSL